MNPTNIGAIFRSAAALGMDAVLLTPLLQIPHGRARQSQHGNRLPDPVDSFFRKTRISPVVDQKHLDL